MRIVFFVNSSWNAYKFRENLIYSFLNKANQVYIVVPDNQYLNQFVESGCKICLIPLKRKGKNPFFEIFTIFNIFFALKKIKPDILFSFTIKPNLYAGLISFILNYKFFPNITGLGSSFIGKNLFKSILLPIYRIALLKSHNIFFQNNNDFEDLKKLGVVSEKSNYSIIPGSGIDPMKYPFSLPFQKEKKVFIFVGRLIKDKGITEFIDSSKHFQSDNNISFRIIGDIDINNPSSLSYKDLEEISMLPNLIYEGFIDNPIDQIKSSYCLVLPSYREGTSRVMLESSSIGRPVIASNVPGCNNIISDNVNGMLCEAKNVLSLKDAIYRMANLPFSEYLEMCFQARNIIEKNFDEKIIIAEYHNIFKV